ncbi:MAG: hypothetical protein HWD58_18200 [Bacteroidota bacterium]|nr:MAG: hypothetical protein HWD58_18200 [Bacteroidota bacterium]
MGANKFCFSGASTPISIVNFWQNSDANIRQNCNNFFQPYSFQRKFKIASSATGTLFFQFDVDDHVESATLAGPIGFNTIQLNANPCPNNGVVTVNTNINFIPGIYTLTFNVSNYYLYGIYSNLNNPTPMRFELEGFVSTLPVQAIVDNNHFGQNTTYQNPQFCSTIQYFPLEFVISSSSACVASGNTFLYIDRFLQRPRRKYLQCDWSKYTKFYQY